MSPLPLTLPAYPTCSTPQVEDPNLTSLLSCLAPLAASLAEKSRDSETWVRLQGSLPTLGNPKTLGNVHAGHVVPGPDDSTTFIDFKHEDSFIPTSIARMAKHLRAAWGASDKLLADVSRREDLLEVMRTWEKPCTLKERTRLEEHAAKVCARVATFEGVAGKTGNLRRGVQSYVEVGYDGINLPALPRLFTRGSYVVWKTETGMLHVVVLVTRDAHPDKTHVVVHEPSLPEAFHHLYTMIGESLCDQCRIGGKPLYDRTRAQEIGKFLLHALPAQSHQAAKRLRLDEVEEYLQGRLQAALALTLLVAISLSPDSFREAWEAATPKGVVLPITFDQVAAQAKTSGKHLRAALYQYASSGQ